MSDFEGPITPPAAELANIEAQVQSVLGDLRPAEVVALHRHVFAWEYEDVPGDAALLEYVGQLEGNSSATACVDAAITALGRVDVPRLEAIATSFADSPDPKDRYQLAAGLISDVTKVTPSVGIPLWDRLLRDESELVRSTASDTLDFIGIHIDEFSSSQLVIEFGVSREQYNQLIAAHAEAERGRRIFNLGAAAVRKLLDQAPPHQA